MKLARDLGKSVPDTRQLKHGGKYTFEYVCVCLLFCFVFPKFHFSSSFVFKTMHKMFKICKFSYPILNNTKSWGTRWQIPGQILTQSRVAWNCFHSMWEVRVTTENVEQYLLGVVNKKQTHFSFKRHIRQKILRINGRKNGVPTVIIFLHGSANARGVSVLSRNGLDLVIQHELRDPMGDCYC